MARMCSYAAIEMADVARFCRDSVDLCVASEAVGVASSVVVGGNTSASNDMALLGAEVLASGLQIKMLRAGDGQHYPQQSQSVAIHYEAFLPGGKMWDSSKARKQPLRFRVATGQVIKGLDQAVSQLSIGSRAKVLIPADLAYGARGFPGLVPPNTPIEFDMEILEII